MSITEKEYRSTMMRIGGALVFFCILFQLLMSATVILQDALLKLIGDGVASYVIYQTVYAAFYMMSFMFPVLFFKKISKKHKTLRMKCELRTPDHLALWVLGGMAIILATAIVNSQIMELFGIAQTNSIGIVGNAYVPNYVIVLEYIVIALVPPFCEEFLFRGMILENLMPYGKTTAIVGSAALFAMMHQNPAQTFYTFCAGIVLGIVYVKSESIWPSIIIHIFNNQYSNIGDAINSIFGHVTGYYVQFFLTVTVMVGGLISIFVIMTQQSRERRRKTVESGVFDATLDELDASSEKLSTKQLTNGFFTPMVIVFTVLTSLSVVAVIVMSYMGNLLSEVYNQTWGGYYVFRLFC